MSRSTSTGPAGQQTRDWVFNQIQLELCDMLKVDKSRIVLAALLSKDLGMRLLDFADIASRLQRRFGIKISTDDILYKILDVQSLVDLVDFVVNQLQIKTTSHE